MTQLTTPFADHEGVRALADKVVAVGRFVGLLGVVLVLLLIGGLKFTQVEIDGLKPIIGPTPWLAWMYPAFGEAGASYLLGVTELATALLLMLSPWSVRAGFVGGVLATLTFFVTTTIMFAAPIWETASGGFPFIPTHRLSRQSSVSHLRDIVAENRTLSKPHQFLVDYIMNIRSRLLPRERFFCGRHPFGVAGYATDSKIGAVRPFKARGRARQ